MDRVLRWSVTTTEVIRRAMPTTSRGAGRVRSSSSGWRVLNRLADASFTGNVLVPSLLDWYSIACSSVRTIQRLHRQQGL